MSDRERLWNDIAEMYAAHINPCDLAVDLRLFSIMQDFILTLDAADIILDIGCGNGAVTDIAQRMVVQKNGNRSKFMGVDISENMIKLAQSYHKDKQELTFYHIKDTFFPDIEDESIDAAMANWEYVTFESLHGIKQSFREVYRVLKPGRRLYFSAHNLEKKAIGMPFSTFAVGVADKHYRTADTIMVALYEWNQRPRPDELQNCYDGRHSKDSIVFPDTVFFPEDYESAAKEAGFSVSYEKVWLTEKEIHITQKIFGQRTPDFAIEKHIAPALIFTLCKP